MDLAKILESRINTATKDFRIATPFYFCDEKYFISVQASVFHHCLPKRNLSYDKYTHFEVFARIPSEDVPKDWKVLFTGNTELFSYVPKNDIVELLSKLDDKYTILPKCESNH